MQIKWIVNSKPEFFSGSESFCVSWLAYDWVLEQFPSDITGTSERLNLPVDHDDREAEVRWCWRSASIHLREPIIAHPSNRLLILRGKSELEQNSNDKMDSMHRNYYYLKWLRSKHSYNNVFIGEWILFYFGFDS